MSATDIPPAASTAAVARGAVCYLLMWAQLKTLVNGARLWGCESRHTVVHPQDASSRRWALLPIYTLLSAISRRGAPWP